MLVKRCLLLLAIVAILVAAFAILDRYGRRAAPHPPVAVGQPITPVAVAPSSRTLMGTAACAGRSCHGSLEKSDRPTSWQQEYTLWTSHDPHVRAYQVLLEPAAKEMAGRLGLAGANAHQAPLCLSCHTNPAAAQVPKDDADANVLRRERSFGIGCEACHGSAVRWLDAHLARDWPSKTAAEKSRDHGLVDLRDTTTLVKTCAGCHVGSPAGDHGPARDVNHDLIAAGHPRLAFEASSYFANLPPHWKPRPRDDVELWALGQVASAEAALELLRHRVQSADAPWPEFAEYDCAGCHHALQSPSWRQQSARKPGVPTWGSWYLTFPRVFMEGDKGHQLADLTQLLEQKRPDRPAIGRLLEPAIAELRQVPGRLADWRAQPGVAEQKLRWLLGRPELDRITTWDAAEQLYLAMFVLRKTGLEELLDERAWPPRPSFVPQLFVNRLRQP